MCIQNTAKIAIDKNSPNSPRINECQIMQFNCPLLVMQKKKKKKKYPLNAFNETASTWHHWPVNVSKELNDEYPRAAIVV